MSDDFIPRTDLIDVDCMWCGQIDNAILVIALGSRNDAVLLPKSQIEIEHRDEGGITVTLQRWLAAERGLT